MNPALLAAGADTDEDGFRVWDDMAVESEVAQFLYGLVRVLKPERVVESGTGQGYAAVAIAQALADNGHGYLKTFEPLAQFRAIATSRLVGLPAMVSEGFSCDSYPLAPDLVFLDSWGEERPRELAFWLPQSVTLLVHDAHEHMHLLPDAGVLFDTPRGLWLRV